MRNINNSTIRLMVKMLVLEYVHAKIFSWVPYTHENEYLTHE